MTESYRSHFIEPTEVAAYDSREYGAKSYSTLLWGIEKRYLRAILEERFTPGTDDLLDFACGTGRVIAFLESFFRKSVGIDISPQMLKAAAERAPKSEFRCLDITATKEHEDSHSEERFDVITCFRFLLNAEPELRLAALKRLAVRLKGRDSVLIINNHGNPFSHKALLWPLHKLRSLRRGYLPTGNYLTHARVKAVLDKADLEVVETYSYGYLSAKAVKLFGFTITARAEQALAGRAFLSGLGVSRIYLCKRRLTAVLSSGFFTTEEKD